MTQDEFIIPLMDGNQRFEDTSDQGSNSTSIKRALSTSKSVSIRPEQLFSEKGLVFLQSISFKIDPSHDVF